MTAAAAALSTRTPNAVERLVKYGCPRPRCDVRGPSTSGKHPGIALTSSFGGSFACVSVEPGPASVLRGCESVVTEPEDGGHGRDVDAAVMVAGGDENHGCALRFGYEISDTFIAKGEGRESSDLGSRVVRLTLADECAESYEPLCTRDLAYPVQNSGGDINVSGT